MSPTNDGKYPMDCNTRPARNLAACVTALILASACGGTGAGTGSVVVRDSAGVQIVENPADGGWAPGEGWQLSAEPVLSIGRADGAESGQFVRIASALRRDDGVIAVADAGQQIIRLYDTGGSFLRVMGGKGKGPGEFEQMASVLHVLPRDSLLAYDLQLQRFSVFASDGTLSRTTPFQWSSTAGFPRPVGVFADGSVLVSIGRVVSQGTVRDGVMRDPVAYLRANADGSALDTIATVAGGEQYIATDGSGGITVTSVLFGGYPVHAVRGEQVALGSNEAYEVGVYSSSTGALQRLIRRRREPRPVTDAAWNAAVRQQLESLDPAWRSELEGMYRKMPRPRVMPFYSAALFDDAGNLWLEEFRAPSDTVSRWAVFEPGGRMLGSVAVPERFRPTHVGRDFVLGVHKDDLDVESVRQYTLVKAVSAG